MKIELGKTYVDSLGGKWRVASVTGVKGAEVIVVDDKYGSIRAYGLDGKLDGYTNHLVSEYNPWHDVKIDTPIWVRDMTSEDWIPRHFAGLSGDHFLAWTNGGTSHSTHQTTLWEQAALERPNSLLADEQA